MPCIRPANDKLLFLSIRLCISNIPLNSLWYSTLPHSVSKSSSTLVDKAACPHARNLFRFFRVGFAWFQSMLGPCNQLLVSPLHILTHQSN
jgi:hypothetical protein